MATWKKTGERNAYKIHYENLKILKYFGDFGAMLRGKVIKTDHKNWVGGCRVDSYGSG
jgi:hypothetical protein